MAVLKRTEMRRTGIKRRPADNHLSREQVEEQFQLLLTRSGGLCEGQGPHCLAQHQRGSVMEMPRERVSIQHRRAQGMGGTSLAETNTLANWLLLCGTGNTGDHGWVETTEEGRAEGRRRGLVVGHDYDDDGNPVPVEDYPVILHSGRRVFLHVTAPVYLPHPDPYDLETLLRGRNAAA